MAQLRVQRLLALELVLDTSAVAIGLVSDREIFIRLVDPVGRPLLPLAEALRRLAAGLILIHGYRETEFGSGVAGKQWKGGIACSEAGGNSDGTGCEDSYNRCHVRDGSLTQWGLTYIEFICSAGGSGAGLG